MDKTCRNDRVGLSTSVGGGAMADILLRGITWDHRRAIDPLIHTLPGFRVSHPGIDVQWTSRPLHGFEFTPVADLARSHDLIILDHPFAGAIAATGCLMPLADPVADGEGGFVGPSLQSYVHSGHLWALPVDAACQVAVSRPDLMAWLGEATPADWGGLLRLGVRARRQGLSLAIPLRGVHSLMSFFTLCANLGRPFGAEGPDAEPLDRATFAQVLDLLRDLLALSPPECLDWNSIALHDQMAGRDDLLFCPAVYGFVTYAEADRAKPLRFHDLPGPNGPQGSTIGGTGLGISAHCAHPGAALAYARYLARPDTQRAFAAHHGQPAHVSAWEDRDIDLRFGGSFGATRRTIEAAWVRPRHNGYLRFQAEAGTLIEACLRGDMAEAALYDALCRDFRASFA